MKLSIALLGSSKPEEQTVFGKTYKTSVKPRERKVTDEEKRYWKKIAENIYKTVKEQFTEADLEGLFDDDDRSRSRMYWRWMNHEHRHRVNIAERVKSF